MDKIEEFVKGTQFLAPGIVVATIFFMFSDVRFDQFGFILFCALAVIIISFTTNSFLIFIAIIYSLSQTALSAAYQVAGQHAPDKIKRQTLRSRTAEVRTRLESARLIGQFALSVFLGVLLVNFYEGDLFYRVLGRVIESPKISHQNTLHFVLNKIAAKKFEYIDERPGRSQICPPSSASECSRDIYLKIKTKQGDVYEGAMRYYPTKLEVQGFYMSPACVARIRDKLEYAELEKIAGPGVYLPIGDVAAIEYEDALSSDCFGLYHPELKRTRP
jgi:hypothetical protein